MITREILHQELNKVDDQFYPLLHKIIAAFESEPKKYRQQEKIDKNLLKLISVFLRMIR